MQIPCPHCQGYAYVRTSQRITDTVRHFTAICRNPDCAAVFYGEISISGQRRDSLNPNASVQLPLGRRNAKTITTVQNPHETPNP
jgi:hypothetical protein